MITADLIAHLVVIATFSEEAEICGYISDGVIHEAKNVSLTPECSFEMDEATAGKLAIAVQNGEQCCIYHSHVKNQSEDFSSDDARNMYLGLPVPWLLIHARTAAIQYADVHQHRSYQGREWHWSWQNCYCLVRDWYRHERGIDLDYFQLESPQAITSPEWDSFQQNISSQGFALVNDQSLQEGDLILMKMGVTRAPNHIAVVVDPEQNLILHHCQETLSRIAPYGRQYRKATSGVWRRHASV
jgi:NlpC/P60 family